MYLRALYNAMSVVDSGFLEGGVVGGSAVIAHIHENYGTPISMTSVHKVNCVSLVVYSHLPTHFRVGIAHFIYIIECYL